MVWKSVSVSDRLKSLAVTPLAAKAMIFQPLAESRKTCRLRVFHVSRQAPASMQLGVCSIGAPAEADPLGGVSSNVKLLKRVRLRIHFR